LRQYFHCLGLEGYCLGLVLTVLAPSLIIILRKILRYTHAWQPIYWGQGTSIAKGGALRASAPQDGNAEIS